MSLTPEQPILWAGASPRTASPNAWLFVFYGHGKLDQIGAEASLRDGADERLPEIPRGPLRKQGADR